MGNYRGRGKMVCRAHRGPRRGKLGWIKCPATKNQAGGGGKVSPSVFTSGGRGTLLSKHEPHVVPKLFPPKPDPSRYRSALPA